MAGESVNINLSLVIPAFNEGRRLASALQRLTQSICPDDTEIIVVDDGSSDDTVDVARRQLEEWDSFFSDFPSSQSRKGSRRESWGVRARAG